MQVGVKVQTMLKNVWSHLCELVEDHDLRCHVLWATYSWYGLEQPLQGNCNDAHLKVCLKTVSITHFGIHNVARACHLAEPRQ